MVIIHVESVCGLRYQVPRCFKEDADKHPRMESVESACKTFLDLDSDSEISRYPTTYSAPVAIAPRRADPCIQHLSSERAVDGLSSDITTWVVASAPYCLTRYDEIGAQSFKVHNPIRAGSSRTMDRKLTFEACGARAGAS
jgi:hypothetical protein